MNCPGARNNELGKENVDWTWRQEHGLSLHGGDGVAATISRKRVRLKTFSRNEGTSGLSPVKEGEESMGPFGDQSSGEFQLLLRSGEPVLCPGIKVETWGTGKNAFEGLQIDRKVGLISDGKVHHKFRETGPGVRIAQLMEPF